LLRPLTTEIGTQWTPGLPPRPRRECGGHL